VAGRRWSLAAVAAAFVAAAIALAGCASAPSRTTSARAPQTSQPSTIVTTTPHVTPDRAVTTVQHVFAAFGPGGAPAAGVTAHRPGTCFTSSITVSTRSAYRCLAGNQLLDPCFVVPGHHRHGQRAVDCYADPWTGPVRLRLTKSLPKPGAPLKIADPWAIRLVDDTECVIATGTSPLLHGVAMRYQCGDATAGLSRDTGAHLVALVHETSGTSGSVRHVAVAATWTA
jgi:hypothetical protein